MQLLKQIWNERRSNGWLWAELLIVFVVDVCNSAYLLRTAGI